MSGLSGHLRCRRVMGNGVMHEAVGGGGRGMREAARLAAVWMAAGEVAAAEVAVSGGRGGGGDNDGKK